MGHTLTGLLHRVVFLYIGDSIPLRSLHVCLVDLSILRGTAKFMVSGDWYVCPVDLVASLCVQCRTDQCLEWLSAMSWMLFVSHALNTFGYFLVVMRSDLVWYLRGMFRYNLVSCTLSGTQS